MLNISETFWHHPLALKKIKTPENDISCQSFSVINEIEIQQKMINVYKEDRISYTNCPSKEIF